jgi:hypothetical protein
LLKHVVKTDYRFKSEPKHHARKSDPFGELNPAARRDRAVIAFDDVSEIASPLSSAQSHSHEQSHFPKKLHSNQRIGVAPCRQRLRTHTAVATGQSEKRFRPGERRTL